MASKPFGQKRTEGRKDMTIRKHKLECSEGTRERKEDKTVAFWRIILSNNSGTLYCSYLFFTKVFCLFAIVVINTQVML